MSRLARAFSIIPAAAFAFIVIAPAPAHAQGIIQAIGGVTSTADQHPVFGGMIGGKAGPVELDGEFGRMQNIVPKRTADLVRTLSAGTIRAELPAWYGMGNLRLLVVPAGPIQPFITVGAGAARLEPRLTSTSSSVNTTVVFGDDSNATKFLAGAGGGLRISVSRAAIDVGYRYIRVFQKYRSDTNFNNDDVLVNVNMFYAAVGVRF